MFREELIEELQAEFIAESRAKVGADLSGRLGMK
jgi:hypothetical protein